MNRGKKALEKEKGAIKTGDDFKKKSTGAEMSIVAESINVDTVDGDGNLHSNSGVGISVRTPYMGMACTTIRVPSSRTAPSPSAPLIILLNGESEEG